MDREEFARRRKELMGTILSASTKYALWLELWPTEERVGILNHYLGFFGPVRHALYATMLMEFAKLFDTDQRTISLRNLFQIGRADSENLLPHAAPVELENLAQRFAENGSVLESLKRKRNQQLAHLDSNPMEALLIKGEFDLFVENVKENFNTLSAMHDTRAYIWSRQLQRSASDAGELLRVLEGAKLQTREETDRLLVDLNSTPI